VISPRYAVTVWLLLLAALVPTVIHSYVGITVSDGRIAGAIPTSLGGFRSVPSTRDETWGKRRFDSDDWMERVYGSGSDEVMLTVVRSYDPKTLYHHPELAAAYGTSFTRYETKRFASRPDVPIHILRSSRNGGAIAMYVLEYDGRYVEDPIWFQIRTAGELLVGGRKAMTLFFVRGTALQDASTLEATGPFRVLSMAIAEFAAQKP
jgi:hypothetical protein